ncbi:MAG TPA: hypothetical protein VNO17_05870 [Actinomycetota bacterium]|nr:hypothetical protein [Actinomycetota bacterium]
MDRAAFEAEGDRLVEAARAEGIVLRIVGALAFAKHCPRYRYLQDALGRAYTDIDFAAYGRDAERIRGLLAREGYVEDRQVYVDSEGSRLVLEHPRTRLHLDVFLDKLEFSHTIPWAGRLEVDDPTIPLAEMLLQKMQIVQINEKDIIDTIMLLLEHPLGDHDHETVNVAYVASLCARDWGLWRTVTMNLDKVRAMAATYADLPAPDKARLTEQVQATLDRLAAEPKSLAWKLRSKVGDRKKWYRDVGELVPMASEETP